MFLNAKYVQNKGFKLQFYKKECIAFGSNRIETNEDT